MHTTQHYFDVCIRTEPLLCYSVTYSTFKDALHRNKHSVRTSYFAESLNAFPLVLLLISKPDSLPIADLIFFITHSNFGVALAPNLLFSKQHTQAFDREQRKYYFLLPKAEKQS